MSNKPHSVEYLLEVKRKIQQGIVIIKEVHQPIEDRRLEEARDLLDAFIISLDKEVEYLEEHADSLTEVVNEE